MNRTTWHPFGCHSRLSGGERPCDRCSFGVSGNVFDMIFAEREAVLTARLRSTTGHSADPEQLQQLLDRIQDALPGQEIPPVAMRRTSSTSHSPNRWRCTA